MKNKKLNLSELKVKSFVTDLENEKVNTVKGGGNTDQGFTCVGDCFAPTHNQGSFCKCK